jgi:hypothetical protein
MRQLLASTRVYDARCGRDGRRIAKEVDKFNSVVPA